MNLTLRQAKSIDTPIILSLIKALAHYERLSDRVSASVEDLEKALFERQEATVILAELDQKVVGFALYFYNFSTFLGKKGLYLEDLFVLEEARNKGIGKALFQQCLNIAKSEGCGRIEWSVLDWNEPSIEFYIKQGAKPMDDWTVYRIEF